MTNYNSIMKILSPLIFLLLLPMINGLSLWGSAADITDGTAKSPSIPIKKAGFNNVVIAQLIQGKTIRQSYPEALSSLLAEINKKTTIKIDPEPVIITSFEDPDLFKYPFIYINFADRSDWSFTTLEQRQLKAYLERGGFIYIDAGINAEFLRKNVNYGQHHSFADWEVTPEIQNAFATIFPGQEFGPLNRDHPLFNVFYQGLPDPTILPDTVRDYVVSEKWPEGTYSMMGLSVKGRITVLASPIISMGWGKNQLGNWSTTIRFRVLESSSGLADYLQTAAYSGDRYEVRREDGEIDIVYCQREALPAWVNEPENRWRVYRYYQSREISDYAHEFYTQLGFNIIFYAMTH